MNRVLIAIIAFTFGYWTGTYHPSLKVETNTAANKLITKADPLIFPDADGDGFEANRDCNDHNSAVHRDAVEVCDGVDNDCDELVDDDDYPVSANFYALDEDGDGYGQTFMDVCGVLTADKLIKKTHNPSATLDHWVSITSYGMYDRPVKDCNDHNAAIHPFAHEDLHNRIDDDCDGLVY